MPINSQAPTIGQFSFSIELPANSYIHRFTALFISGNWQLTIKTTSGQIATLLNPTTQKAMTFQTLDGLAHWLASQGVDEMSVFLPVGNGSTMGGAE